MDVSERSRIIVEPIQGREAGREDSATDVVARTKRLNE